MDTTGDLTQTLHLSRKQARRHLDRYRVTSGKDFRLKDHDPADTAGHLVPRAEAECQAGRSVWSTWRRCRRNSTHRTAGRCCACSRRWTPPARTARSST